jgi:hypothetical protein
LDFKLHIMDEPTKKLPIIGVLSVVILIALIHISGSVVDYTIWEMDRNAPTINTLTPPIPRPWQHAPAVRQTPDRDPEATGVCDDECQKRSVIFI